MASDNSSYFSNAYPGEAPLFDGNIFALTATPKFPLGFRVTRADGSVYRYGQFGAATNRAVLVSQDISESGQVDSDNALPATVTTDATKNFNAIGSRFVEITMASQIANIFMGGYFITTDDTGESYTYRIKGNTATGNPASGTYYLELYEPLVVALDNTTDFAVIGCIWTNMEVATRATDSILAGVSLRTSTAALPFAFVQVKGVCGVLQDIHVPAIGDPVCHSTLVAGSIQKYFGTGSLGLSDVAVEGANYVIGYCVDPGDSTGHTAIVLNLPW